MNADLFSAEAVIDYGRDLDWTPARARNTINGVLGDLKVNSLGDLETVDGVRVVIQSRIRELLTPYGYIGRYVEDIEGVKYVDGDYGNLTYLLLSEPTNNISLSDVADACTYVMLKDVRVRSAEVKPNVDPERGLLLVKIDFTLQGGADGSFTFALNPGV